MRFRGHQSQFYIDLVYGFAFSLGFGYLLFVGMDPLIAAFQGGLVLGYFLRVWENMSVYERILEEEVAAEAEDAVAEEIETQVRPEVEERVPEEVESEIEERVPEKVQERVEETVDERISTEFDETDRSDERRPETGDGED